MSYKAKFSIGQRVIVKPENTSGVLNVGYYGHVSRMEVPDPGRNVLKVPVYYVHLKGRVGREAAPWMLSETEGFNPFGFWEFELEAAD